MFKFLFSYVKTVLYKRYEDLFYLVYAVFDKIFSINIFTVFVDKSVILKAIYFNQYCHLSIALTENIFMSFNEISLKDYSVNIIW